MLADVIPNASANMTDWRGASEIFLTSFSFCQLCSVLCCFNTLERQNSM